MKQYQDFGKALYQDIFRKSFGSVSKSELEMAYFSALATSKIINLDELSNFELAFFLQCTPTRASNIRFNYDLRTLYASGKDADPRNKSLANHTVIVGVSNPKSGSSNVTLNVESKFWRNVLMEEMKKADIFSDTSFNRERLIVPTTKFIKSAPELFGINANHIKELIDKTDETKPGIQKLKEFLGKAAGGTAEGAGKAVTIAMLAKVMAGG